MLISLKLLVLQRADVIGHEQLANKFDLKMLRAIGIYFLIHPSMLLVWEIYKTNHKTFQTFSYHN